VVPKATPVCAYGQPPPGLDVRLSLDLDLQRKADELLSGYSGGLVLLDASNGEILAIASHPTFNANQLDQTWSDLVDNPASPLLNRTTQGLYPAGASLGPFLLARIQERGSLPSLSYDLSYDYGILPWTCSDLNEQIIDWGKAISSGCPGAVATLGRSLGTQEIYRLFLDSGFFEAPKLDLPALAQNVPESLTDAGTAALGILTSNSNPDAFLRVSPLQMSLAAAALSNQGERPAPRLASAVNTPQAGWVILPAKEATKQLFSSDAAEAVTDQLAIPGTPFWLSVARAPNGTEPEAPVFTWVTGGTTSVWQGSPMALDFVLEEDNPALAYQIGLQLLETAIEP
jgi:peptidoglycan glycosyltransferase